MTILQIVALCVAGPIGLMCFLNVMIGLFYKSATFHFWEVLLFVLATVGILITFLGIK